MSIDCLCGGNLGRIGIPNCYATETDYLRAIIVPKYQANGTRTVILNTDFAADGKLPDSYIINKFDVIGWGLTPDEFEEGAPARTDRITQTSARGTIREISKGVKTYSFQLWGLPTAWASLLNSGACQDLGVYFVDSEGKLCGEANVDNTGLYPREIQKGSLVAEDFDASPTTGRYTQITFQLARTADESKFFSLPSSSFESDLLEAVSPVQAYIYQDEAGTNTATNMFIKLLDFNNAPIRGYAGLTDYLITEANGTPVAATTIVESKAGHYQITFASTSGDLSIKTNKTRTSTLDILYQSDSAIITTP